MCRPSLLRRSACDTIENFRVHVLSTRYERHKSHMPSSALATIIAGVTIGCIFSCEEGRRNGNSDKLTSMYLPSTHATSLGGRFITCFSCLRYMPLGFDHTITRSREQQRHHERSYLLQSESTRLRHIRLLSSVSVPTLVGIPEENQSQTHGSTSQRTRRGKYPVVELWRHTNDESESFLGSDRVDFQGTDDDTSGRIKIGSGNEPRTGGTSWSAEHTALGFLQVALSLDERQMSDMLEAFPALAELHPDKIDLRAKLMTTLPYARSQEGIKYGRASSLGCVSFGGVTGQRFIKHTMGVDEPEMVLSFPQFFGYPLERHTAPRHAFLVASGRPSGARLLADGCRGLRRMLELPLNRFVVEVVPGRDISEFRRLEQGFCRGGFDAARRGDAEILRLLRSHGWDCSETDRRGRTALFWAAGGGSTDACEALTEGGGGLRVDCRGGDGSTPLHWAAVGVEARRFGTGGHVDVCRWLLTRGADGLAATEEGNTVVMWAAWAGGLKVTRWAIEDAGADLLAVNANGCSVAHWAASGGDEAVCRYLHSKGVVFSERNKGGNDPLNHAVAYGRRNIAAWLLDEVLRPPHEAGGELGDDSGSESGYRRRDDPVLLDLARLTGDEKMEAFLTSGVVQN